MDYRVEELARAAGVGVDTVRFYQGRGLLPGPERRGRIAIYQDAHLERLKRIRKLNRQGLTLEGVKRALERDERAELREALLGALERAEGERSYSPEEFATAAGLPGFVLELMRRATLLEPVRVEGEERYAEADLRSARAARQLLEAGLPLEELLPLAQQHAAQTRELAQRAVELFERAVRRAGTAEELSSEALVERFQALLPAATTLVALHFQRALIEQVRARLARGAQAR
jgi:DNA-binding transcriptional MerR regulator